MTSNFYFTATSWFPGNVRVKPHQKHSAPITRFQHAWIIAGQFLTELEIISLNNTTSDIQQRQSKLELKNFTLETPWADFTVETARYKNLPLNLSPKIHQCYLQKRKKKRKYWKKPNLSEKSKWKWRLFLLNFVLFS